MGQLIIAGVTRGLARGSCAAVLTLVLAFSGMATAKVYLFPKLNQTAYGYQERTYQPRVIDLPDRLRAVQIHWAHWGSPRAVGVGHVVGEPHNVLRFTATAITNDARAVAGCPRRDAPSAVRYYGRLMIRAASRALAQDDQVGGNFAGKPTIQC